VTRGWQPRIRAARAVLFDFDGTLAPNLDLPDLRRRVVELTLARGVPEMAFAGRYIVEIVDAGAQWLARQCPHTADLYYRDAHRLISDFETAAARATAPFPDVPPALGRLRDHGKALGVVTRNCRAAVQTVFPDLDRYCTSVLARDDVAYLKPDVRHLSAALDALDTEAAAAVMVGDGQLDMHIGRALGLYCVGVLTGSGDEAMLWDAGADVVLPRAADLAAALEAPVR
jgi:phosphoglycolate phosphatase